MNGTHNNTMYTYYQTEQTKLLQNEQNYYRPMKNEWFDFLIIQNLIKLIPR